MGKWNFVAPSDVQVQQALAAEDVPQACAALLQGEQKVVVQSCATFLDEKADGKDAARTVFAAMGWAFPCYRPRALFL